MVCSILGNYNAPDDIAPTIGKLIADMVNNRGVDTFVINSYGNFFLIASSELMKAKKTYPHLKCKIITTCSGEFLYDDRLSEFFDITHFNEIGLFCDPVAASACVHVILAFSDIAAIYDSALFLSMAKAANVDIYQI